MNLLEQKTMEIQNSCLCRIAKELERANKLKALELKGRQDLNLSPKEVDAVMERD